MKNDDNKDLDLQACREAVTVCACANFRMASRAVTQLFDETLQPSGLRSTQLVILISVATMDSSSVVQLARQLVMDRSTLARNLKPLQRQNLIKIVPGDDRRTRVVTLTARGRAALKKALPLWEIAQTRFIKRLGPRRWKDTLANLSSAVEASREAV